MKPSLGALTLIAAAWAVLSSASWASTHQSDVEYLWRKSSGPQGERNPAAVQLYAAILEHDAKGAASALRADASANMKLYPNRWSPLMVAVASNDRAVVDLLIARGADLNYVSDDVIHPTPLAVALSYGRFSPSIEKPDFALLRDLLDAGADVNVEFRDHKDIAYLSATLNQFDLLNELLARGYRRDLKGLKTWLLIGRGYSKAEPARERAIMTVDRLMRQE